MTDPIESAISRATEHFLNYSHALLASQIVTVAIQLSSTKNKNDIYSQMDLAVELIENAKKKITKKMIHSS